MGPAVRTLTETATIDAMPTESFGTFLRMRRSRVTPEMAGLRAYGTPRRVAGLRREELAQLAGVSVGYYTRLEQDQAGAVSMQVIDALAPRARSSRASRIGAWAASTWKVTDSTPASA